YSETPAGHQNKWGWIAAETPGLLLVLRLQISGRVVDSGASALAPADHDPLAGPMRYDRAAAAAARDERLGRLLI
ncbi:hypothetical protein ACWD6I_15350, partial [Streptomyces sp. NPDC002454]